MSSHINPFQQAYFADDDSFAKSIVRLFSNKVLGSTAINPIFAKESGHVVLCGPQGCGKTMVLNLLRPQMKLAYEQEGVDFPVKDGDTYISSGVNITRKRLTNMLDIGYSSIEEEQEKLPRYFSDLFNFTVLDDLCDSLKLMAKNTQCFKEEILDFKKIDKFVQELCADESLGALSIGSQNFDQFCEYIKNRLILYKEWMNGNKSNEDIEESMLKTKTSIGEPFVNAARILKKAGVVNKEASIFVRIDQIEELHGYNSERQSILLPLFRSRINRLLSSRDTTVSYRIGVRTSAWEDQRYQAVSGVETRLENRRDYTKIVMDKELFIRGEHTPGLFSKFASDAFKKRMEYYYGSILLDGDKAVKRIFGRSPKPENRLGNLSSSLTVQQIFNRLKIKKYINNGLLSDDWIEYLVTEYKKGGEGILNATLAVAWGKQSGGSKRNRDLSRFANFPKDIPWINRKWWRKERLNSAVLHACVNRQQRVPFYGFEDILALSGGNITIFLHICHRIWDAHIKSEAFIPESDRKDLMKSNSIGSIYQSSGILNASEEWYDKIVEEPDGHTRQRIVTAICETLNRDMLKDDSMSYPGGNGFSLSLKDIRSCKDDFFQELVRTLYEMEDYRVIMSKEHSSKIKGTGRRVKFYPHPILCPRFQLPIVKTKEPRYWAIDKLLAQEKDFAMEIGISDSRKDAKQSHQNKLF